MGIGLEWMRSCPLPCAPAWSRPIWMSKPGRSSVPRRPPYFQPDSAAAHAYHASLGARSGEYKARKGPVRAVVIHTTGAGPVRRLTHPTFERWRERHPGAARSAFSAALWVYRNAMKAGPHYVVGQLGQCVQLCPEQLIAWHVGKRDSGAYRLPWGGWVSQETRWWLKRWNHRKSPRQLAGGKLWAGGSCNANTIGIEVVPPEEDTSGPWSDACWSKLGELVTDICFRHDVPCDAQYVLTHSDAHPRSRSTKSGLPWDPGPRQWSWAEAKERWGAPF